MSAIQRDREIAAQAGPYEDEWENLNENERYVNRMLFRQPLYDALVDAVRTVASRSGAIDRDGILFDALAALDRED